MTRTIKKNILTIHFPIIDVFPFLHEVSKINFELEKGATVKQRLKTYDLGEIKKKTMYSASAKRSLFKIYRFSSDIII